MNEGRKVVLTREAGDNDALADALTSLGIETIEYPCIATKMLPYDGESLISGRALEEFGAVIFSSRRGVAGMAKAGERLGRGRALLCAVGPATASALEKLSGRPADLVSANGTGAVLAEELVRHLAAGAVVLHVRGSQTTGNIPRILASAGIEVHELTVYENRSPDLKPLDLDGISVAVFASPSAARRFFEVNPSALDRITAVAIGPTTAKALRELGVATIKVASRPDVTALVKCVADVLESSPGGKR